MAGFAYNRLQWRSSSMSGEGLSSAIAAKRSRSCSISTSWDRSRMLMIRTRAPFSSLRAQVHSTGVFVVLSRRRSCWVEEIGTPVLNVLFSRAEMRALLSRVSSVQSAGNDELGLALNSDPSNRRPSRLMAWTARARLRMRVAEGSPSRRSTGMEPVV